ncbi:hypothetical protein [Saccharopolyspora shandongensis]|uniref:hypothetical protein n=1 Tax=Saccharopolyspora shandongensis TaxID=418495 RepID=UPI0034050494
MSTMDVLLGYGTGVAPTASWHWLNSLLEAGDAEAAPAGLCSAPSRCTESCAAKPSPQDRRRGVGLGVSPVWLTSIPELTDTDHTVDLPCYPFVWRYVSSTASSGVSDSGDGCRHLASFAVDFWQLFGSNKTPINEDWGHRADVQLGRDLDVLGEVVIDELSSR